MVWSFISTYIKYQYALRKDKQKGEGSEIPETLRKKNSFYNAIKPQNNNKNQ